MPGIELIDEIREEFGAAIEIVPGGALRPFKKNQGKGQSPTSQHQWGRAFDLRPAKKEDFQRELERLWWVVARVVARQLKTHFYGRGRYDRFVHVDKSTADQPGGRARSTSWDLRKKT
jgi:hypothetical protein